MCVCEGVNLRTGRQGIFPGAHVTDVDYSDFDPQAARVKKERYLLTYEGSIETRSPNGNEVRLRPPGSEGEEGALFADIRWVYRDPQPQRQRGNKKEKKIYPQSGSFKLSFDCNLLFSIIDSFTTLNSVWCQIYHRDP